MITVTINKKREVVNNDNHSDDNNVVSLRDSMYEKLGFATTAKATGSK